MFSPHKYLYSCVILFVINLQLCTTELVLAPSLVLYSPGEPEYLDVLVRRVNDNLTLVCELRGDSTHRNYVWNYVPSNLSLFNPGTPGERPIQISPVGPAASSTLQRSGLQVAHSGHYMCSVPPFSVTKYIAVQTKGPVSCARGAFSCGARCVLPAYVCDGRRDCARAEDELAGMCAPRVCDRPDKLNCSSGRCIAAASCCRGGAPLCQQPACCDEYTRQPPVDGGGLLDAEFPPLYEDRRAPDDYGFIQSTIYTVTACALIFMIAVVLLVSAICKMQMKRAALRGYSHADRAARDHYSVQYHQAHSFPPCYEASRLLERDGITVSPSRSPAHAPSNTDSQRSAPEPAAAAPARGLARLSAIFSSRYRQVPTHPEVEMTSVPPSPGARSPCPSPPLEYRSPTYCDLNTELVFSPEEMGRELNYMATPVEFYRRRTVRRNTLERVMDQLDRQRLTLQLGRFQLSIPRLGRSEPRPDTPVAEPCAALHSLHSLRLDARDTYTLNGRTIRLLGADIQHSAGPPSYSEAVRYKLYGPPPEYLSREGLNQQSADVDQEAANNVEMPPRYDDLGANDVNGNSASGFHGDSSSVNGISSSVNGISSSVNGISSSVNGISSSVNGSGSSVNGISSSVNGISSSVNGISSSVNGISSSVNGSGSSVNGISSSVNGSGSSVNENSSTVIGNNISVNGDCGSVIGNNDSVNGKCGSVIGHYDSVNGNCGSVIGNNDSVNGNCGSVIGNNDSVNGNCGSVIGNNNRVNGSCGSVIGNNNIVNGNGINANGNTGSFRGNNSEVRANDGVVNSGCGERDAINGNETSDTCGAERGDNPNRNVTSAATVPIQNGVAVGAANLNSESSNVETLSSIIDNLPAIDSDVNANDAETGVNNDHVLRDAIDVAN